MLNQILTIHGPSACGKSALVTILRDKLRTYKFYSTGDTAKALAAEAGMDIGTYIKYVRTHNIPFDEILDDMLKEIGETGENWIIDSRLGYHFIPHSFKVYIDIDIDIATQRRYIQGGMQKPKEEVRRSLQARNQFDGETYFEKYGTDCKDMASYDFVTDNNTDGELEELAEQILLQFYKWLEQRIK